MAFDWLRFLRTGAAWPLFLIPINPMPKEWRCVNLPHPVLLRKSNGVANGRAPSAGHAVAFGALDCSQAGAGAIDRRPGRL